MALALSIFGIAFAALCIWLTVRIVNRRERWAKRTLPTVVILPVLYVASFGPWCWWTGRIIIADQDTQSRPSTLYRPILWIWMHGPARSQSMIDRYANLCSDGSLMPGEATREGGTYPKGTMALTR